MYVIKDVCYSICCVFVKCVMALCCGNVALMVSGPPSTLAAPGGTILSATITVNGKLRYTHTHIPPYFINSRLLDFEAVILYISNTKETIEFYF